jgi:hypothetical protein
MSPQVIVFVALLKLARFSLNLCLKLKAMKPRIAFFAAASLVATGMTLASNVSFGQRAGKFLADALDVMGPISSLMSGIVKPNLDKQARPTGDYALDAIAAARQDSVSLGMRNQSMLPTNILIAPSTWSSNSNNEIATRVSSSEIQPGPSNVPAAYYGATFQPKTLQPTSLLSAFIKGAPSGLSKDREDVWQFLNSRPGQFDTSKLLLSADRGERIDKEIIGTGNAAVSIATIVNETQLNKTDIIGTTNANNLTPQSLLSKNPEASVPVPASSLVLVAGFASLFGVSLMAKKSKAKKSKKAAK